MRDRAIPSAPDASADSVLLLPGVLEAVIRALAGALTFGGAQPAPSGDPASDRPQLDLEETANSWASAGWRSHAGSTRDDCHRWSSAWDDCKDTPAVSHPEVRAHIHIVLCCTRQSTLEAENAERCGRFQGDAA
jgi:hypothetical protein